MAGTLHEMDEEFRKSLEKYPAGVDVTHVCGHTRYWLAVSDSAAKMAVMFAGPDPCVWCGGSTGETQASDENVPVVVLDDGPDPMFVVFRRSAAELVDSGEVEVK